ncbi:MAG: DNA-binding response regulator [Rhizobiaceae bacterium]|nr:DNA-binding response regulator [Rhizobiaceae bacterium]
MQTSLHFMLEAEGHASRAVETLAEAAALRETYDCAIVDHKVIGKSLMRLGELGALSHPVVLLVDQRNDIPRSDRIYFVEKPFLGSAVVEAVERALSGRQYGLAT